MNDYKDEKVLIDADDDDLQYEVKGCLSIRSQSHMDETLDSTSTMELDSTHRLQSLQIRDSQSNERSPFDGDADISKYSTGNKASNTRLTANNIAGSGGATTSTNAITTSTTTTTSSSSTSGNIQGKNAYTASATTLTFSGMKGTVVVCNGQQIDRTVHSHDDILIHNQLNIDQRMTPADDSNELILDSSSLNNTNGVLNQLRPKSMSAKDDGYKRLISGASDEVVDETDSAEGSCICRVCNHKTIRRNWKVFLASVVLTVAGFMSIVAGLALGARSGFLADLKSIVFIVGGVLLIIPGGYHFMYMCLAAYGVQGFKFTKLPTLRQTP